MNASVATPDPTLESHPVPARIGVFGTILFLVSLGMLFAASMLGYVLIRIANLPHTIPDSQLPADSLVAQEMQLKAEQGIAFGAVHVPPILWVSTLIILVSSFTIHRALVNIRIERQQPFKKNLVLTLILAAAFLVIQTPGLILLLTDNRASFDQSQRVHVFMFALIVIHALHVLGGIIPLALITRRAKQGRYDHECHGPVQYIHLYWHFLDVVWLVMFGVFLIDPIAKLLG